jgi:S-adenosylmethionine hydrolase
VAAHLAADGRLEDVGARTEPSSLVRSPWPEPSLRGAEWSGEVIYVDRFGNLVTNLPLEAGVRLEGSVTVAGRDLPLARTYSDVSERALLALRGSSGLLEIACNRGSAAEVLGAGRGLVVTFHAQLRS